MPQYSFDPQSRRWYYVDQYGQTRFQDDQQNRPSASNPRNVPKATDVVKGSGSASQHGEFPRRSDSYTAVSPEAQPYNVSLPPTEYSQQLMPGPSPYGHAYPGMASSDPSTRDFGRMTVNESGTMLVQTPAAVPPLPPSLQPVHPWYWRNPDDGREYLIADNPLNEVRTMIQTGPEDELDPQGLSAEGIVSHMKLVGTKGESERLFKDFRVRSKPRDFFTVGKVFRVLWSEPAGETSTLVSALEPGITFGRHGEPVYSKVRRFVVIRAGDNYCSALSIVSYGRRGVSKPGVNKSEHGIIFSGKTSPEPLADEAPARGERPMRTDSVRINTDNPTDKLDVASRLDYGKVYTIQHNIKVHSFGQVHPKSMNALLHQFRNVWTETEPPLLPSFDKVVPTSSGKKANSGSAGTVERDKRAAGQQSTLSARSAGSVGSQGQLAGGGERQAAPQSHAEVRAGQARAAAARLVQQGYTLQRAVEIVKSQHRQTIEEQEDSGESGEDDDEDDEDDDQAPRSTTRSEPTQNRQPQSHPVGTSQQARASESPQQTGSKQRSQVQAQYQYQRQTATSGQNQTVAQLQEAIAAYLSRQGYSKSQQDQYIANSVRPLIQQGYTQVQALQAIITQFRTR